jgi:sugar (pentulose or hexulose) kinase
MGLWIVQECKRYWRREGVDLAYDELTEMAEKAAPFAAYIDPDRDEFLSPGNMPEKINNFLSETGQKTIDNKGQMVRAILESLAFKHRWVLERLEEITGNSINCLHIVGGGIQNELLCRFLADAVGKKLLAGPMEATAIGNILMQAKAAGQIESLAQARRIVCNSFELKEYQAKERSTWEGEYKKFRAAAGL